jgi:hypothetical protein
MESFFALLDDVDRLCDKVEDNISKLKEREILRAADFDFFDRRVSDIKAKTGIEKNSLLASIDDNDFNHFLREIKPLLSGICNNAGEIRDKAIDLKRTNTEFTVLRDLASEIFRKIRIEFAGAKDMDNNSEKERKLIAKLQRLHKERTELVGVRVA